MPTISQGALKDSGVQANQRVHGAVTKWDEEVMPKRDKKTLERENKQIHTKGCQANIGQRSLSPNHSVTLQFQSQLLPNK